MKINGSPKKSFKEQNAQLVIRMPWKEIYDKFDNPSILCWSLYLICDRDSQFYDQPVQDRRKIVKTDYLEDKDIDLSVLDYYVENYSQWMMGKLESQLYDYELKRDERNALIKDTDYTLDNADKIDKLIKEGEHIDNRIEELEDKVRNIKKNETYGGGEESLTEKNLI